MTPNIVTTLRHSSKSAGGFNPWHVAYCLWFHHQEVEHPRRAAAWGWIADRLADRFS